MDLSKPFSLAVYVALALVVLVALALFSATLSLLCCLASAVFLGASAIASAVLSASAVWLKCCPGGVSSNQSVKIMTRARSATQMDANV